MSKKFASTGAITALGISFLIASFAGQAAATEAPNRNGECASGEFCLYYNSDQQGSVSDFTEPVADYGTTQPACWDFKGSGAGQGKCVKNHAASAWNRTPLPVTVFYRSDFAGRSLTIPANGRANLGALKNENASHQFGTNPTTRKNLSFALYNASGGEISCPFDGYVHTKGAHEGIDFRHKIGAPVHALVDGKITAVRPGKLGRQSSKDISTITIYNAQYNKTVVYLHTAPLAGLSAGQTVSRGQRIATESWRGVSIKSSAHTHVEMRVGNKKNAAVSVGDSELQNPNPTKFWNSLGYTVR